MAGAAYDGFGSDADGVFLELAEEAGVCCVAADFAGEDVISQLHGDLWVGLAAWDFGFLCHWNGSLLLVAG